MDEALAYFIQYNRYQEFDEMFRFISNSVYFICPAILFIGLFVSFKMRPKLLFLNYCKIAMVSVFAIIVTYLLKYGIQRPRPFKNHQDISQLMEAGNFSFPSGHTLIAFTIAFGLYFCFQKKYLLIPIFVWAFAVAYSRIILGVHYPSDIIASIVIAYMLNIVFFKYIFQQEWFKNTTIKI